MNPTDPREAHVIAPGACLESASGLKVQMNRNGSIRRIDHAETILNLFLGNEMEGGPANLYLRRHGPLVESIPLLGPHSSAAVSCDAGAFRATGVWRGIRFEVSLRLADAASVWFWHVALENTGRHPETLDLVYVQDLALAQYGGVRLNEYYVSQYVDHTPLTHARSGVVVASRQNLAMKECHPWCLIGSLRKGVAFATDALQVHGLATRSNGVPLGIANGLPGVRHQHEHAMAAIQDEAVLLEPGAVSAAGFFGVFEGDHRLATSNADLAQVDRVLALPEATADRGGHPWTGEVPVGSLFSSAPLLQARRLSNDEILALFGGELREVERQDGRLLSFFAGERTHVVMKAKELAALRPHGHILRTGSHLTPDESALTSTVWMAGVFHSAVTQGHVGLNRFLSNTRSYLSLFKSQGQRVFVELENRWWLLDVPSAFAMTPSDCSWYFKYSAGTIRVRSEGSIDRHELSLVVDVLSGPPARFLVSHHIALNGDDGADEIPVDYTQDAQGVCIRPNPASETGKRFPDGYFRIEPFRGTMVERAGRDELLFADGHSRQQPYVCLVTASSASIGLRITGHLISTPPRDGEPVAPDSSVMMAGLHIRTRRREPMADHAARLGEIFPWFVHNALIHYLAPRGLEQYSGGGWGTRDVTQGPVEMLLALGRFEAVRDLLLRVFKAQNADGDWPQWFAFFDRDRNSRASDSHGDIVFWPLLALGQYLMASGDASLLAEEVPFFDPEAKELTPAASIRHHIERALRIVHSRLMPGTHLVTYGHGDWNDSLQPANPTLRERLCSAWTVTLHYQTLQTLAGAFKHLNMLGAAARFALMARDVRDDFQRLLVIDGIVAGFAYFEQDARIDYLLHPRDTKTGLCYSLLAMVHGIINDLLTPQQARTHLEVIEQHLLGPDGARLFDRPMDYHGGPQRFFQRAESSSFFGREIGLMYTHAQLRYAEALWRYGDADGFFVALCKVNPIGLQSLVPNATLRQGNCYYSSSDAVFGDRYAAYAAYKQVIEGKVPVEGGWRIYSSGAGIATSLILRNFLGLRQERAMLVIDPAIPARLDGMWVELEFMRRSFRVGYRVKGQGCGPTSLRLNGADLLFTRGDNPYRTGAAEVLLSALQERLVEGVNELRIAVGADDDQS